MNKKIKICVVGTVGLPANYGGFETLVENLAVYHMEEGLNFDLVVYCSSKQYKKKLTHWAAAELRYLPFKANGVQSVIYDVASILHSVVKEKADYILVLGVSGAIVLPVVKLFCNTKILCNIDGLEWKREKWGSAAKRFLKFSEKLAVVSSHTVIADNSAISEYIDTEYNRNCEMIPYGGDHAIRVDSKKVPGLELPKEYLFSVCRIEKENNIALILKAFKNNSSKNVVIVGNWANGEYGRSLKENFSKYDNIFLLDPIYDLGLLKYLRENCIGFVHGHSAGGTNPSLVEAMWFGKKIYAFDCSYNRHTTENCAYYFSDAEQLSRKLSELSSATFNSESVMLDIAKRRYTWSKISQKYFGILSFDQTK